jgi:hypothetical protein
MRYLKLRIAWSAFCCIACVLLIVLWVRSYWQRDGVIGLVVSHSVVGSSLVLQQRF